MLAFSFRNISGGRAISQYIRCQKTFSLKGCMKTVLAFAGHVGSLVVAHLPLVLDLCDGLYCTKSYTCMGTRISI